MPSEFDTKVGKPLSRAGFQTQVFALDNAQQMLEFPAAGNWLFLDRNTTGAFRVRLNDPAMARFPMGALDLLADIAFDRIFLSWVAQPGLIANLWWGFGDGPRPGSILTTVQGITSIQDYGRAYGVAFDSNTPLAANTPENILAAGSNINGARIVNCNIVDGDGATADGVCGLLAKATAPATIIDGDLLLVSALQVYVNTAFGMGRGAIINPLNIAAGLRLDFLANRAQAGANRNVRTIQYTLF